MPPASATTLIKRQIDALTPLLSTVTGPALEAIQAQVDALTASLPQKPERVAKASTPPVVVTFRYPTAEDIVPAKTRRNLDWSAVRTTLDAGHAIVLTTELPTYSIKFGLKGLAFKMATLADGSTLLTPTASAAAASPNSSAPVRARRQRQEPVSARFDNQPSLPEASESEPLLGQSSVDDLERLQAPANLSNHAPIDGPILSNLDDDPIIGSFQEAPPKEEVSIFG